jgi:transposase
MPAKLEVIELEIPQLESLLEKIRSALGEEVAGPFRQLLDSHVQLLEIIGNQKISLRRLRQLVFGAKTERTRDVLGASNAPSGDALATARDGETAPDAKEGSFHEERNEQNSRPSKRRRRKGHGRNGADAYPGCQQVAVPHGSLKAGDTCPCCAGGKVYLQTKARPLVRLVGQAPVGGTVYKMERLRCHLCGEVFTAEPPAGVGEEKYDATAVSMMAVLRYGNGVPWNRSAQLQQSMGIPLPASTQWGELFKAAQQLVSVYEHLIFEGAQGDLMHNDDTPMRVVELMNEKTRQQALRDDEPDRRGIFTSNILSIGNGHSIALFFTGPRHAGENLRQVLARRAQELPPPTQMCDALSRNMPEDLKVILGNCLSHGRRRFVDVAEAFPQQVLYVLEALKLVYQVDAEAKQQELSPQDRLLLHQQRSGPVMEELHRWLNQQLDQKKVEPNSSLGEAIRYLLKHWKKLTLFLRQPGAPLDNNICERALKKAILHRKNSLFYRTRRGAFVGDLFMSLIHTCFLCAVDPFDYITQLLRNHEQAARHPAEWMPWNYRAPILFSGSSAEGIPSSAPASSASPRADPADLSQAALSDTP